MPRLSALRVGALRDIANQFRFAPRAKALAALDAIESLAPAIDPERAYEESWLVHRLTGYRPEPGPDAALLVGGALHAELSALAEHISAGASLRADEVPHALRVEDLCARWGVSRRTVERSRRRGLVARRVTDADGVERLLFTARAVELFESAGGARPGAARRGSRTTPDERDRIVRRARRYRARFGCTMTQAAERIALRTGRSRETVRRALLEHDRGAPSPIFPRRRVVEDRRRDAIMLAQRRGVPLAALAQATGRTRESVARISSERALARLREFDLRGPVAPTFEREDAGEVLLAPPIVREGAHGPEPLEAQGFLALARTQPPPDARDEATLGVALAYLRHRARTLLASLPAHSPPASALDRVETDLRWAHRLAVKLACTQRRVALAAIEERVGGSLLDLPDALVRAAHRSAMRALAEAALRFDPMTRGRLAGRAAVALSQALALALRDAAEPASARSGARRTRTREVTLTDWTRDATPWGPFVSPDPRAVAWAQANHAEPDAILLATRFGLSRSPDRGVPTGPPLTLDETARAMGMTLPSCGARLRKASRVAIGLDPTPSLRRRYPAPR